VPSASEKAAPLRERLRLLRRRNGQRAMVPSSSPETKASCGQPISSPMYSRSRLDYIGCARASWSRQNGRTKLVIRRSECELQGRVERLAALVNSTAATDRTGGRRQVLLMGADRNTSTAAAVTIENKW
jgi:hypothetical protein